MAKRPLADLIEEQNRLARAKAPSRPFTVVRVLVAGRYNGPDLKSQRAQVDDLIAIAAGQYATDVIADGLVEIPVEEPEEAPVDEPKDEDGGSEDTPSDEPEAEDEPEDLDLDVPSDFAKMKVVDLRSLASAAGIDSTGLNKAKLIQAIEASIEALRRAS